MAERPAILRGLRVADAVALAACAVAMTSVAPARARRHARRARRPPRPRPRRALFAFQRPGGTGYLRRADGTVRPARPRPGARRRPGRLARRAEPDRASPPPTRSRPSPATTRPAPAPFAFSDRWVVWLVGGNAARRRSRATPSAAPREVARARGPSSSAARRSPAQTRRLPPRRHAPAPRSACSTSPPAASTLLRSEHRALLSNPTFDGRRVLYVRSTYTRAGAAARPPAARARRPATSALHDLPDRPPRPRPREGPPPPPRRLQGPQAAEAAGAARPPASPTRCGRRRSARRPPT